MDHGLFILKTNYLILVNAVIVMLEIVKIITTVRNMSE